MDAKHGPAESIEEQVAREKKALEKKNLKFTGTAMTLVYRPHNGFANYAMLTMEIKDGVIASTDISQPYNANEARSKLEIAYGYLLEKLRSAYPSEYRHA